MSTDSAYAVELKGLTFKRGSRAIFDNIDVRIPRGKVTGIMGPSGCGKTTLLRLIASQLRPSKGEVWVNGQNLPQLSRGDLFDMRKQFGVLFQSGALFTDLDVFENVAFPLRVHTQLPEEMIRDIVLMKLQAVGLRGAVELMPDELSGGMKRRVALARAIALDPQILLYDEPFVGQDPIAMGVLVRLIRLLNDALGITSIVVPMTWPRPPASPTTSISSATAGYLATGRRTSSRKPTILVSASSSRESRMVPFRSIIRPATTGPTCWESADA